MRETRGRENQGNLMKSFRDEVVNRHAEEGNTIQEVAKILLLLQQMRD